MCCKLKLYALHKRLWLDGFYFLQFICLSSFSVAYAYAYQRSDLRTIMVTFATLRFLLGAFLVNGKFHYEITPV